jgi:hypothetical protein
MTEVVHPDYEVKSEFAVCHWEIPVARLHDITPTATNPACVTGVLPGAELSGTILTVSVASTLVAAMAEIDFTPGMVYLHDVRNVLTYVGGPPGAEATWGPINIGDPVFYDRSTTMGVLQIYLSTAPTDNDPLSTGALANSVFGWVVPGPNPTGFDTDAATFPHGAGADATATTHRLYVMQKGSGL